ncbi:tetraacyldisaccharide 4'-kinase [candidate division KSB1 bacterium]|nr:tetraacyldisaccharide 4'-kinase [candidate division KSB1 bacterium]RQW00217.1 MAG: tetraacyldisaccharide 4'-kinase [candidate division KSB1 bacterium]
MRFFDHKWPALLLWPFSQVYVAAIALRNFFYDVGLLQSHIINSYLISVGNITVGGTGKTPTVHYLARSFLSLNKRVAIISRGYGRQSKGTVVVSDGQRILASVHEAGDEPLLLAQACSGAIVIVDSNRVRAAQLAVDRFKPDIILLDDAFQHRRIHRDFDLVTLRRLAPFGNGFCLPAGPLRESRKNLSRAHAILFNGPEGMKEDVPDIHKRPVFYAHYVPQYLVNKKGKRVPLDLAQKRIYAFCGLANPHAFRMTLAKLGVNFAGFAAYKDHYYYQKSDIENIYTSYERSAAEIIVTTEKDWVKLPLELLDEHWYRLHIEIKPVEEENFLSLFEIVK